ncbi:MAG: STAS domain-containing protein [Gammaproteobacteria bacterium]|nr:STAS domain-containing protein [Gammaproteobacteria bacterium]
MSKQQTIKLGAECTIYEVLEKHHQIIEQWKDLGQSFTIDMSSVEEIDNSFVQLLLSCKKTAITNNSDCELINIPDSIKEYIESAYYSDYLFPAVEAVES